jgi:hypothetical protein
VRSLVARLAEADDALYRAARARDRDQLGRSLDALGLAVRRSDRERVLDCICEGPS